MHRAAATVLAFAVGLLGWSARSSEATPWPFGVAPSSSEVRRLVDEALALARRSRLHEASATIARKEEIESTPAGSGSSS